MLAIFVTAMSFVAPLAARVDEAYSMVMEVVGKYVEDGFALRADYWNGELATGKQKLIRHQLFLGNDYWFWLGSSTEGCNLQIEVYDAEGMAVSVERTESDFCSGVRVTPSKTGSYYILVKIDWENQAKKESSIDWAVVYGYR